MLKLAIPASATETVTEYRDAEITIVADGTADGRCLLTYSDNLGRRYSERPTGLQLMAACKAAPPTAKLFAYELLKVCVGASGTVK